MESLIGMLKTCLKYDITLEQFVFLSLIKSKDFADPKSIANQYIDKIQKFSVERVIAPLIEEKEYVINVNQPGQYYPELLMTNEAGDSIFATYHMGLAFWEKFPKTLPLGGGARFVSRSGIDREDLIELYLRKISHSESTHDVIMKKLEVYESLVLAGKLNGNKIIDFVSQQLWEVIDLDDAKPKFGTSA